MPCSVPSSPGRPCSTLSATSGLSARSVAAIVAADIDAADACSPCARAHRRRPCRSAATPRAPPTSRPSGPRRVSWGSAATPIRLISHSSSTPEFSFTRARTVSPSVSMSAALAPPRLIRKLQCSSDTCASPTVRPRQPAASISCQAFWPGGFLKVEPPVRLLIGCVASRVSVILSISAAIASRIAGVALEDAPA